MSNDRAFELLDQFRQEVARLDVREAWEVMREMSDFEGDWWGMNGSAAIASTNAESARRQAERERS